MGPSQQKGADIILPQELFDAADEEFDPLDGAGIFLIRIPEPDYRDLDAPYLDMGAWTYPSWMEDSLVEGDLFFARVEPHPQDPLQQVVLTSQNEEFMGAYHYGVIPTGDIQDDPGAVNLAYEMTEHPEWSRILSQIDDRPSNVA